MVELFATMLFVLRIFFGQLSMAMLLLIICIGISRQPFWAMQRRSWLNVLLLIGVFFYPLALGLGRYDPYVLGYDHRLLILCAVSALVAVWRYPLISVWLTLAAIAHAAKWGESNNLWDYLFDPFAIIAAFLWWLSDNLRGVHHAKQ